MCTFILYKAYRSTCNQFKVLYSTIVTFFSLQEACTKLPKCKSFQDKLNTCNDRVNSRTKTEETCLEELIDYVGCIDHCAAKVLMSKLK